MIINGAGGCFTSLTLFIQYVDRHRWGGRPISVGISVTRYCHIIVEKLAIGGHNCCHPLSSLIIGAAKYPPNASTVGDYSGGSCGFRVGST